jgi:hypothetical protein
LREVIRKEAATERRREKCKRMDTRLKKEVKAVQKFQKKKKSVIPIKRLAKIFEEIERRH